MRWLPVWVLVSYVAASAPAWAGCAAGDGPVKINELIPDPAGSDGGQEWVELYNDSASPVDLDGWKIATKTGSSAFSSKFTFPASSADIPAHGWLVVADATFVAACEPSCAFPLVKLSGTGTLGLGNDTSKDGDAVRLTNASGQVVDTVAYRLAGGTGAAVVPDDCVDPATSLAGMPASGKTLARAADGADTDASATDFAQADGTLGAANAPPPPTCDATNTATGLVINEFLADQPGAEDQNKEWIELYNGAGRAIDLTGYALQFADTSAGGYTTVHTFAAHTLAAGARVLAGESAADPGGVDFVLTGTLGLGNGSSDAVRLVDCEGHVVDTVIYGGTGGFLDDTGAAATSTAPTPGDGHALARTSDGADTNQSGTDFVIATTATPGTANPVIGGGSCDETSYLTGLVINEFLADQPGTEDQNKEWVELYNGSTRAIQLSGYLLQYSGSGGTAFSTKYTFGSFSLDAGEYLVVGESAADPGGIAFLQSGTLALGSGSGGDAVRLVDCASHVVDTVVYGGTGGTPAFNNDLGAAVTTDFAPTPGDGHALARTSDGHDTQNSASDFVIATTQTPGTANPIVGSGSCDTADYQSGIVINELLPDQPGTESQNLEWVELYNGSGGDVDLDGWTLEYSGAGTFAVKHTFEPFILQDGAFVVLGESAANPGGGVDFVQSGTLGMGSGSGGDAVRIKDCAGTVVDTVIYGDVNTPGFKDDTGAVASSVAPTPGDGVALARVGDGEDTNHSGVDFVKASVATPGTSNTLAPPSCQQATTTTGIVINEFLADQPGAESQNLEWIELYNGSGAPLDLEGWTLEFSGTGAYATKYTFSASYSLDDQAFVVVGESAANPGGGVAFLPSGTLGLGSGSGGDAIRLRDCAGGVVDTVVYGGANTPGFLDDTGALATSFAPAPGDGGVLARHLDGADTQQSGTDFFVTPTPSPGTTNFVPPPPCDVATVSSGIVINEFLADQPGNETQNLEWIELYNGSGAAVDLKGWYVRFSGSGTFSTKYTFDATHVLADGGHVLIGESAADPGGVDFVLAGTLGLGSGAGGDALQLRDCQDHVVDTVVYGGGNTPAFLDDTGAVATSIAPTPGDGGVLARSSDGADTQQSGVDFRLAETATPGTTNPLPPACEASAGTVKINEFLVDPAGADSTVLLEWVELYNASEQPVALRGWQLRYASAGDEGDPNRGYDVKYTFGDATIAAGGFFVLGEANVPDADAHLPGVLGLGTGSNGDGVRLTDCLGADVDTVVYGGDNTQGLFDDTNVIATSVAPKPGTDQTVARRFDGVDTDQSGDDFFLTDGSTRGSANPEPPVCVPDTGDVVINEILPNPAGSDSDVLLEWVELFNPNTTVGLTLDGWKIGVATSGTDYGTKATFPAGTYIGPGDYLLIGEANVPDADLVLPGTLGLGSGSGGDGVRLIDCQGNAVDTVVYGDATNEQEIIDDSGFPATSVAASPADDASLGRKANGVDTDLCGEDFVISSEPTPGAANPTFTCVASTGTVLINEFLPDPNGSDGDALAEWFELYNSGTADVQLDGWGVAAKGKPDETTIDVVLPPGTTIPAGGFFVVGGENVPEADYVVTLSIGNGTSGDALSLLDCEGTLVDTIVYGSTNDDGHLDESGAVATPAPNPGSDKSLARTEDGVDTDTPDDWFADLTPTPGETNHQEPIECPDCDTGHGCNAGAPDGGTPGGGCGSGGDKAPGEGCVALPGSAGGFPLLVGLLVIALRRRRAA